MIFFPSETRSGVAIDWSWTSGHRSMRCAPIVDRVVALSSEVANQIGDTYPRLGTRVRIAVPGLDAHAPRRGGPIGELPPPLRTPFLLVLGNRAVTRRTTA